MIISNNKTPFIVLIVFTLLAVVFSTGFHHPDEYMQIIEFANVKIGGMDPSLLPWEWAERMRPFFQPTLFYLTDKILRPNLTENPFFVTTLFRLFHALVGLLAVYYLILSSDRLLKIKEQSFYIYVLYCFLWFMPWMLVRPSSEGLSASLVGLAMGIYFYYRNGKAELLRLSLIGILCGLSFLVRYQIGFMVLGFGLWLLIIERIGLGRWLVFCFSILLMMIMGVFIDEWGYGEFTLTTWNYIYQNVFLNKSAKWGTDPFWGYLYLMQQHGMPLHSLVILVAYFLMIYRYPRHVLTWTTIPFLIVHSLIQHKEMRFLFPMAIFVPYFLVLGFAPGDKQSSFATKLWSFRKSKIFTVLVVLNFIGLIYLSLLPSRTEIRLQHHLYENYKDQNFTLYVHERDPYILGDYPMFYYRPQGMRLKQVSNLEELKIVTKPDLIVSSEFDIFITLPELQNSCSEEFRGIPRFLKSFNFNNWLKRTKSWSLLSCSK